MVISRPLSRSSRRKLLCLLGQRLDTDIKDPTSRAIVAIVASSLTPQRHTTAITHDRTASARAWLPVINAIAIADVERVGRTEPPNRRLDQAREGRGIVGTVAARINQQGSLPQDVGAAIGCVTFGTIPVPGIK